MIHFLKKLAKKAIPAYLTERLDAEAFSIDRFIRFAASQVKRGGRVLDAGAGTCPYEKYFAHARYESTDFENIFDASAKGMHDFICSLDDIPKPDNSYDAIINTQVLEHVEDPYAVAREFYRVLKPGGSLFLTAPQGWGIHGAPYHFFNFTRYGLESVFRKAGFSIVSIEPRGGMFWYLGKRIKTLPSCIFSQYGRKNGSWSLGQIVLSPLYALSLIVCGAAIPLLFFYLDPLDKKRDYTLGYACQCVKDAS